MSDAIGWMLGGLALALGGAALALSVHVIRGAWRELRQNRPPTRPGPPTRRWRPPA